MDTDPNSEVSALLDALDVPTEQDATADTGSEAEGQEDSQAASAADEQQQDEASDDANDEGQEEQASQVIEFDGKQWELPPGTPPEIAEGVKKMADDLKADYTRKRQAAAEEEKAVKETAKTLQELSHIAQATHAKSAQILVLSQQLQQLEQVDLSTLADSDPAQAIRVQSAITRLQRELQGEQMGLQQLAAQERQKLQAEKQRRQAEMVAKAPEVIPGFNEKVNQELLQTVTECGFSAQEVAELADVRMLKLINLARLGLQFQKQAKPAAMKKVAEAPRVVKPQAPLPRRENQSALDRLQKTGRAEHLVNFL